MPTEPKIDPTVPLRSIPEDKVVSAEWTDLCDEKMVNGQAIKTCHKVPTINGIQIHAMMDEKEMKKIIDLYPKVMTMLPFDDEERRAFIKSRGKQRPAEIISLNGVRYTVPKNIMIKAPLPIAEIIENMVNPIRIPTLAENAAREEFNPLGPDVPFDL